MWRLINYLTVIDILEGVTSIIPPLLMEKLRPARGPGSVQFQIVSS